MAKKITAMALVLIMMFGAAPLSGLAGIDLNLPAWFDSPFETKASASTGRWGGETATSFASGTGTEGDPYIIRTAVQLAFFSAMMFDGEKYTEKYFKLANDIVLNSADMFARDENGVITGAAEGKTPENWMPIGYLRNFEGYFDGCGHTVSGIYINTDNFYQGLFGRVSGEIKNVGVIDSYIFGNIYVGGVVGKNYNGKVTDCYNTGTVSASDYDVGGVVGLLEGGTVTNCYNTGAAIANDWVGGVVGRISGGTTTNCYNTGAVKGNDNSDYVGGVVGDNRGIVIDCYNTGAVSGTKFVGGVFGQLYEGTATNCYNIGTVSGTESVGGVAGNIYYNSTVSSCYNTGAVSGSSKLGGVTGNVAVGGTATNCYNTGAVNGNDSSQYVGGVVGIGDDGSVSSCYNTGAVSGSSDVGGVVGLNSSATVRKCYYLTGTAVKGIGRPSTDVNTSPLTDEQMKLGSSFVDWDFSTVWTMDGKSEYLYPEIVNIKRLTSVSIASMPTRGFYLIGDTLDAKGLTLTASYNIGPSRTITSGFICSPTVLNTAGTQTITVSYTEGDATKTCTFTVEVVTVAMTSIAVKTMPSKTSYFVGDTLDTEGLTIEMTNSDDSKEIKTSGFTCTPTTLSTAGEQTVTVSYTEDEVTKTCTFTVEVTVVAMTGIAVKTMPSKTSYFIGETLDTTGLSIELTNNNASKEVKTSGFTCTPTTLSTAGEQTITVSYTEGEATETCTFTVNVAELTGVAVATNPNKTSYYVGDTLDTAGLTLTASYNNSPSKTITSGFNCTPTALNTAGTQTVTVSYTEGEATGTCIFTVDVVAVAMASIAVKTMPSKTSYYVGDTLDTAGLSIELTNNNGSKETKTSGFSCTPTALDTAGTQTITVSYTEDDVTETCTFTVDVVATLSAVEIIDAPETMKYREQRVLTTAITPSDVVVTKTEWSSSDTNVATVDQNGKVTAVGRGSATITVKVTDSSGATISAQAKITFKMTFFQRLIAFLRSLFGGVNAVAAIAFKP